MSWIPVIATAAVGLSYVGVSLFFLKNPRYLHKKKKVSFNACRISHRGGAGEYLENTMTAFKHAMHCGCDMLELDCHITKDNQVVVSHDNNLYRTTGVRSNITDLRYDELPLLNESLDINRAYFCKPCEDKRIPLLKDVFDAFPNVPINVDIKIDDDRLIEQVSSLVKTYNRENITVWGNYRDIICKKCYKHNPNIHMLVSLRRVIILVLSFYIGLLPFLPMHETFFEIVMPYAYLKNSTFTFTKRQKFLLTLIDFLVMRKWMFDHLQKRGIRVFLWVLNTDNDFDRAFHYNVDGVMTDFPTKLNEYLLKNHQSNHHLDVTENKKPLIK